MGRFRSLAKLSKPSFVYPKEKSYFCEAVKKESEHQTKNEYLITPMNQKAIGRIEVVDALRGIALFAIVVLHCFEHYNLYCIPQDSPQWLTACHHLSRIVVF